MCWNRIKARMHKWQVAEWLRAIRRWMANWDAMDENRTLLSPMILSPSSKDINERYRYSAVRELRNAIDSDRCNNIAITGVYGSGKSSVIQTYLAERSYWFRSRKVLSISLSNFIDTESLKTYGAPTRYENEIEQKIFQHILHKTNQNKTRQTRYGRISHISIAQGIWRAFAILLSILSLIFLFVPVKVWPINVESWFNSLHPCTQAAFECGTILYLCLFFIFTTTYLIRRAHLFKWHGKINASNLELEWHAESSKIDKLIDEILYFFKAGGYKIVVFEDLDRIKNPERLFLKLREINILLNESDYFKRWNRSIKFIYAIRDDVFNSEIRTKCFDYIIPVIPVVDKYNAVDYLLSGYRKNILSKIDETDISVMGMFIESKRELSNIINEYATYHDTFTNLSGAEKKLLALLIYKNAFPKDYAAAYSKEGCLPAVFAWDSKKKFYQPLIEGMEEDVKNYDKLIAQHSSTIQSCRRKILMLLEQEGISQLIIEGRAFDVDRFEKNDRLYEMLVQDKISKYVIIGDDYSEINYDKKFEKLLKEAYPEGRKEYDDTMRNAQESLQENINEKNKTLREIEVIKNQKLSVLINQRGLGEARKVIDEVCESVYTERYKDSKEKYDDLLSYNCTMLFIFVVEGFIEDDYASYMSHTYPGALTEKDVIFVNSVLQGIYCDPKLELKNIDAIKERLRSADYRNESILNFYFVDNLIQENDTTHLMLLIETARKHPDFIVQYSKRQDFGKRFTKMVMQNWENALIDITNIEDEATRDAMYRLYIDAAPCDMRLNDAERLLLGSMYQTVCQSVVDNNNFEDIKHFIRFHDLKFSLVNRAMEATQALYDFVLRGNYFEINMRNLRVIYSDSFNHAAFSQIYSGDKVVMKYLLQNPVDLLRSIPESSTEETPEVMVKIINNQTFQSKQFDDYISRQSNKINMAEVQYDNRVPMLLSADLVRPTWENVGNSLTRMGVMTPLVEFVKLHIDELSENKCDCEKAYELGTLLLIVDKSITDEEFYKLLNCFSEPFDVELIENLPENKLRALNKQDLLYFDDKTIELISTKSPQLFAEYLIINFDEFISKDDMPVEITNEVGIELLNSSMTLDQKKQFMDRYPFEAGENNAKEYARLYCFYYEKIGDFANADMDGLIAAMNAYDFNGEEAWRIKISIVNQINRTMEYNKERETQLLKAINKDYAKLIYIGCEIQKFDKNPENEELLGYLKLHRHYVSDVKPIIFNKLKVTFRHK